MSMHKIPLMEIERIGLQNHGLDIGTPSQLSDVFRQGVRHALTFMTNVGTYFGSEGHAMPIVLGAESQAWEEEQVSAHYQHKPMLDVAAQGKHSDIL